MSDHNTPKLSYPEPRYASGNTIPRDTNGRVREIEISAESITLEFQNAPGLPIGEGRHYSLHQIHSVLQSMLRLAGLARIQRPNSRFHTHLAPSYGLPLRRILPLEPASQPQKLPATLFHFRLKKVTVNLGYDPLFLHREGILLYTEGHPRPYQLRVEDEIHALMRLCELRHGGVEFEAIGFHPSNITFGQIIYLVGPQQEVIGENPFALGKHSRKGVQA